MTDVGQSPIDLVPGPSSIVTDRPSMIYHGLTRATLTDIEFTVSVAVDPGGLLTVHDRPHALIEIHSHAPAEHTIAGVQVDLETHFVHQASDGALAVVAILFKAADGDHLIDPLIAPPPPGGSTTVDDLLNLSKLFPKGSRRYLYTGSRTTQPYTPGVQWIVHEDVQPVGRVALAAFMDRYDHNHRDVQPLGDRAVVIV